jgi:hypothetical protein
LESQIHTSMNSLKTQWKEKWVNQPSLMLITVVIWSIFIGLCIQAGAVLFTFIYSWFNPIVAQNLFDGLNLYSLKEANPWYYAGVISFVLFVLGLKAYLFYLMIRIFLKIDLVHPFSQEVSKLIATVSYTAFQIGIGIILATACFKWLAKKGFELDQVYSLMGGAYEFLLMAAILVAVSQIFKRGVELQAENELTV